MRKNGGKSPKLKYRIRGGGKAPKVDVCIDGGVPLKLIIDQGVSVCIIVWRVGNRLGKMGRSR